MAAQPMSAPIFKEGDVIIYSRGKGEAIISSWNEVRQEAILEAWRPTDLPDQWIHASGGTLLAASIDGHHPDPDRVWAEFVTWRLSQ